MPMTSHPRGGQASIGQPFSTRPAAFLLLALLGLAPGLAHAQPLFALPGDVQLVPVDDAASAVIGTDRLGFVWEYGEGGMFCYDPADRAGTQRAFGAFDHVGIAQRDVYLDPSWAGPLSYEGLRIPNPDFEPGGPQLTFQAYTCTGPLASPMKVPMPTAPEWEVSSMPGGAWRSDRVFWRGSDVCVFQSFGVSGFRDPRPNGRLLCIAFPSDPGDPSTTTPTVSFPLDVGALDAALGVPTWASRYPGQPEIITYAFGGDTGQTYVGPPFEGWTFAAPVVTPTGRVFFIATRQTAVYRMDSHGGGYANPRWVLELRADGSVVSWLGPADARGTSADPLGQGLWWHEATRSLLVATAGPYEFGNYIQCGPDGFGNLTCSPHGPGGMGFFHVSVDSPGVGYFSIRDAASRATRCHLDSAHTGCTTYPPNIATDRAGRVILTTMERQYNQPEALGGWKDIVDTVHHYRLDFDPGTFDMDGDGLTREAEDALGTSDYAVDSDGGFTFDAVETGVLASNPATPSDDVVSFDQNLVGEPRGYGTSRLVRGWIPQDVSDYYLSRVEALSPDAPLCIRGRCLDIHTQVVMNYPTGDTLTNAVVSADASFIAFREGTAFKRKRFSGETGDTPRPAESGVETYVAPGELERFIGAQPPLGRLYPISEDLSYWVQTSNPPLVVAFDRQGKGTLVFDLLAAACDSELDACAPEPLVDPRPGVTDDLDVLVPTLDAVGFHAATQRLLVGAKTNWRQFLIALEADRPAVILAAKSEASLYPDWYTPTGHGHDYVESGGNPFILTDELAFAQVPVDALSVWVIGSPKSYWGDVTLLQAWTGRSLGTELPDGVLEAVWFPPEVAPGETLAFDPDGAMLTRIGLRGGAIKAWSAPDPTEHGVTGVDVTADLRLCMANPRAGRVREYLPRFGRAAPSVTDALDIAMPDAIDCAYGEDGALRVLVSDPPAVWVREPGAESFEIDRSVTVPARPLRFIRGPSATSPASPDRGFAEVIGADDAAAGRVVTRAGVVVDIPKGTWDLRWNGVVVANLRNTMFWFGSDPRYVNAYTEVPGDVAMVERADGRIVLTLLVGAENVFPGPYLYEPRSGAVYRADEGYSAGRLMAVVPGGENVDPWTGDGLGPPVPRSVLGPAAPTATPAPTGGTPVAAAVTDEGCAGGHSAGLLGLALVLVVARRSTTRRLRAATLTRGVFTDR